MTAALTASIKRQGFSHTREFIEQFTVVPAERNPQPASRTHNHSFA